MSLNRFMHEDNIFKKPPDFKDLALRYTEFRKHVEQDITGKVLLDFKNPDSLRTLSKILLLDVFGLSVTLPEKCLIPTIPSRLNYLLWIKDLIKCLPDEAKEIRGLDIGTGASAVYCLLAARHLNWNMLGTEVDPDNFEVAVNNVSQNNLKNRIKIVPVGGNQILDPGTWQHGNQILDPGTLQQSQQDLSFQFSMCNPPFFVRDDPVETEHQTAERNKDTEQNRDTEHKAAEQNGASEHKPTIQNGVTEQNVATEQNEEGPAVGKDCEIKTQGGEVKFIKKMADQSIHVKDKISIFTTLCGHKSSVVPIKQYLNSLGVTSLTTTEFCQGRTMRWGVAWTWRSQLDLNTIKSCKYKKSKEKPFSWSVPAKGTTALNLFHQIKSWLNIIKVELTIKRESKHYCSARMLARDTQWKNQRKQRRQKKKVIENDTNQEKDNETDEGKFSERLEASSNDTNSTADNETDEGKFSERLEASSNDTNSTAESGLITEILNSNGKRVLNSLEVTHNQSSDQNGAKSFKLSGPEKSSNFDGLKSGKDETDEVVTDNAAHSEKVVDDDKEKTEVEPQLEANINLRLAGQVLLVEISYLGGQAGRDGVHQILQYIKNKHSSI